MDYTDRFEILFRNLIVDEGNYLPSKEAIRLKDEGGATKYGISLKFLRSRGVKEFDFNYDGIIDDKDIMILNLKQAKEIYYRYFYSPLYEKIYDIRLANLLFNFGVNAGRNRAVKLLQTVINKILKIRLLKVDGIFGKNTLAAVNNVDKDTLFNEYANAIEMFYKSLNKPQFIKGWLNRLKRAIKFIYNRS